jgi:hypothetical protein
MFAQKSGGLAAYSPGTLLPTHLVTRLKTARTRPKTLKNIDIQTLRRSLLAPVTAAGGIAWALLIVPTLHLKPERCLLPKREGVIVAVALVFAQALWLQMRGIQWQQDRPPLLGDFEDRVDLALWRPSRGSDKGVPRLRLACKYATRSEPSLEAMTVGGAWSGPIYVAGGADWRGYERLALDLFNPGAPSPSGFASTTTEIARATRPASIASDLSTLAATG